MKKTVKDIDIKGKKVIMRVDFNVPLDKETNSKITDTTSYADNRIYTLSRSFVNINEPFGKT